MKVLKNPINAAFEECKLLVIGYSCCCAKIKIPHLTVLAKASFKNELGYLK